MRVVKTGNRELLELSFVKNYLKIDPDITIEDDVIQSAMNAAYNEACLLYMYEILMDEHDVIIRWDGQTSEWEVSSFGPVQKVIHVKVKKWGSANELEDVHTLDDGTEYEWDIDANGLLSIQLTEQGQEKVQKNQFVVAHILAGVYQDKSEVPEDMKKAVLKMIGDGVERRVDEENIKTGDWRSSDRQVWLRRQWRF